MRIRKEGPPDEAMKDEDVLNAAKVADALAHPARIRMLRYILTENLARRTVTNKDLVAIFDYAQATISQHVSKLLVGGLLEMRKRGTSSCYFARIGRLSMFMEVLKRFELPADTSDIPEFLRAGVYDADDANVIADLSMELDQDYYDESEDDGGDYHNTPSFLR
ncbi:MAG: helix-turn-helix domain-containing protein [Clostridiales bacterium]|nr:helix-turn-helix domain-containing protein [Clostridiales bacterium]